MIILLFAVFPRGIVSICAPGIELRNSAMQSDLVLPLSYNFYVNSSYLGIHGIAEYGVDGPGVGPIGGHYFLDAFPLPLFYSMANTIKL